VVVCSALVNSVSYLRQIGRCLLACTLSVTGGRLAVVCWRVLCQLLEADWTLSVGVYSVSYRRQIDGCLQCVSELCHLHKADWRLSAGGVHCQLREECWWLSAGGVCIPSVTFGRLTVFFNGV
jgi:hypothetical protein